MDLFLLSHLVQRGRYHVDPELVAEAILRLLRPELTWEARAGSDRPRRRAPAPAAERLERRPPL